MRVPTLPKVFVCASAVGYYGDRGDGWLSEGSASGSGFLAEVCRDWEAATDPVLQRGVRVVSLRIGMVLSPSGGALAKMLPAFRLGLGGPLGNGRQWISWIALDDLVHGILFALVTEPLRGPVNAVTPNPVTNQEFTTTLGRVLGRPVPFRVPALAIRTLLGQMADDVLLSSARVAPSKWLNAGFSFQYPSLEAALRHALNKG